MSSKYRVVFSKGFEKSINKIDKKQQVILLNKLMIDLDNSINPRQFGKALVGNLKGLWRYRYGDYRIIVHIQDNELIILALEVGHRKDIYKK